MNKKKFGFIVVLLVLLVLLTACSANDTPPSGVYVEGTVQRMEPAKMSLPMRVYLGDSPDNTEWYILCSYLDYESISLGDYIELRGVRESRCYILIDS